ncbi:LacI family DNA-binding transcriptional regulator [Aquibium carbonis]|uniref:LacI family DNA-binding transcriptional regulator n=1 Tax=Aquibium carbonis TaxID=2495581 RepID=A0A429YV75_9HYPH|nr:LacI family DNA-binding transcriptional regulator [Aquibium carbonis]RST85351.1 LacI family DNA-binding transcriptional regulator [Aquibium carbonis]
MSRPTVNDIAKAAGVSLATVDRVLNQRPGVTEKTVGRVNAAIDQLGYVRDVTAANLARQRRYRMTFVLPETPVLFVGTLREAIAEAVRGSASDRTDVRIVTFPADNPHALVRALRTISRANTDGMAIFAPETPHVRDAIARLKADGVPIVALVSDLPNTDRDHFVGIDNVAAGRTAGLLMGKFHGRQPGAVMVLVSSMQARDNVERRLGFDRIMAERFPRIEVLPSIEGHDNDDVTARVVNAVLDNRPDITGIYSIGHGSRALLDLLRARMAPGTLSVVAHELTKVTRDALKTGMFDAVISQNVGHIVRSAIRVLRAKSDGVGIVPSQERIRIEIVVQENLP